MAVAEKWQPLKSFPCPISGCPGSRTKSDWVCAADYNNMFISQMGNLKCSSGSHHGKIITWKFDCGNHGHNADRYRQADFEGFTYALSQAVQYMGEAGATWVAALVTELGKQYGKM